VKRRALFKAAAATAAAVVLAPLVADDYWHTAGLIPTIFPQRIWGDGEHDDTAALQALIDDAARRGVPATIRGGTYLISRPIVIRSTSSRVTITNAYFTHSQPFHSQRSSLIRMPL
jgi:hypothetical protein